jgi:hypothetical protein
MIEMLPISLILIVFDCLVFGFGVGVMVGGWLSGWRHD